MEVLADAALEDVVDNPGLSPPSPSPPPPCPLEGLLKVVEKELKHLQIGSSGLNETGDSQTQRRILGGSRTMLRRRRRISKPNKKT